MSENPFSPFSNDGKTKLENLISLSEAYIKKLPRAEFQANRPCQIPQRKYYGI